MSKKGKEASTSTKRPKWEPEKSVMKYVQETYKPKKSKKPESSSSSV